MWRPGTVLPDKDNKWLIDIIDPEGTPLTLRGFETCGKAKAAAREKAKELNVELRDVMRQRVVDQRRKILVHEEASSNDPNESADEIHAEMSLEKYLNDELDRTYKGFSPDYIQAMRQMDDLAYDPNDEFGDDIERSLNEERMDETDSKDM